MSPRDAYQFRATSVTPVEPLLNSVPTTITLHRLILQNPSIEARISRYCHIGCDVSVAEVPESRLDDAAKVLAVQHNTAFHTFDVDQPEDDITAWMQALHFMDSQLPTLIHRRRLYSQASAPMGYDIARLFDAGIISLDEARYRFHQGDLGTFVSPASLLCVLDHNVVMAEIAQHLTYTIVNDDGKELGKAYISGCDWGANLSVCRLTFTKPAGF